MKIASLALILALGAGTAVAAPDLAQRAPSQASAGVALVQDAPVAQIAQAQDGDGGGSAGIDVNVDVDRGGRAWFASPIWIAIFVLGGLLLLVLVAMAARGGGSSGQTIVK